MKRVTLPVNAITIDSDESMVKQLVIAGSYQQYCRYYEGSREHRYISCEEDMYGFCQGIDVNYVGTFWDNPAYGSDYHRMLEPGLFEILELIGVR